MLTLMPKSGIVISTVLLTSSSSFILHCIALGDKIKLRRAMKQLKLLTLPQVFIIHLKRFSIDHIVTKNSIQVKYPAVIDVKEYCTQVRIQLHTVVKLVNHAV